MALGLDPALTEAISATVQAAKNNPNLTQRMTNGIILNVERVEDGYSITTLDGEHLGVF
jgi:hypothetical protein